MQVTTIRGDKINLHSGMQLEGAMLRDLSLDGIDLSGSSLRDCYFNESSMTNANLSSCDLTGAVFYRTNLKGADLTQSIVDMCYWNEVIYDESTKWPAGFTFEQGRRALSDEEVWAWSDRYPTGLCTPGTLYIDDLDVEILVPQWFVPRSVPLGRVSVINQEKLFLRLAALIYRGIIEGHDGYWNELNDGKSPFFSHDLPIEGDLEDILFTHICFALLAVKLKIHTALDQNRVEVTFEPFQDMRTFSKTDHFKLFTLICEEILAVERDEDEEPFADFENVNGITPTGVWDWSFAEAKRLRFDYSKAWDEDPSITRSKSPTIIDDPRVEILDALVRYHWMSSCSRWSLDEDVSGSDDDDFDIDDDEGEKSRSSLSSDTGMTFADSLAIWYLMGVESVKRLDDGTISAILKPRLDIDAALAEINYTERDEDQESRQDKIILNPRAGKFAGHLSM